MEKICGKCGDKKKKYKYQWRCPTCTATYQRNYNQQNRDITKQREYQRRYTAKRRQQLLDIYGRQCACCEETEETFLTIDHIHGGGTKHRREAGGHVVVVTEMIRDADKTKYQTLCRNCNYAKHLLGTCPHLSGE